MSTRLRLLALWLALFVANLAAAPTAQADVVRIIASNAVKEVVTELVPAFERRTGHQVVVTWGGTIDITARVEKGEAFEIAIIPGPVVDRLVLGGAIRAGTRRDFADSLIGAAVAPGTARRDVSSSVGLRKSLLEARSIVLSSGPSSLYLLDLFRRMQIEAEVLPKMKRLAPGLSVGEALARGEGELGFTQLSELLHVNGIVLLGPLGPEVQHATVFSIGQPSSVPGSASATQLIDCLTSTQSKPAIRRSGLEPR